MNKYLLIYKEGVHEDYNITRKAFETQEQMLEYINGANIFNLEGFILIFCGVVHKEFKLETETVVTKVKLV